MGLMPLSIGNPFDLPVVVIIGCGFGCGGTIIGADDFNIREIACEIVEGGDGLPDGVGDDDAMTLADDICLGGGGDLSCITYIGVVKFAV
jgi:hypothetical protein